MSSTKERAGGVFMLPIFDLEVHQDLPNELIEDILAWSEGFREAR